MISAALLAGLIVVLSTSTVPAQPVSGVPILVYHRFGPVVADGMTVTTDAFAGQLAWLQEHDYRVIPLRALVEALRDPGAALPPRAVAITVDDGHRSVYTEMLPLIRRYHLPVTLFVYPSAISNADYALTWEQLVEIVGTGVVDVQSHTYWHPNFNHERARLSPNDYRSFVMTQLTRSKSTIARRLGTTVDMLAWPFGIHDSELEQAAAAAGYDAAFALERRAAGHAANPLALPRYLMTDGDRGARFAAIVEGPVHRSAKP